MLAIAKLLIAYSIVLLFILFRTKGASQTSDQVAPGQTEATHSAGGGLTIPHAGQGGTLRKLSSADSGDVVFAGSSNTINFTKSFGQSRSREILKRLGLELVR